MADPEAALGPLGDAVDAIESRFCCTGEFRLAAPLKITPTNGSTATFPVSRGLQMAEVAKLRACSEPSPFGRGSETVVDETVRKAIQIKADSLDLNGFELPATLLETIRSELVPDTGAVTAHFHKMNIYETGGFFADHKDTPRSELHFGSLVVCLPCAFEGGTLAIDHLGEQKQVDWARNFQPHGLYSWQKDYAERLAAQTPSNTIRWAAFFGDANHKVVPVKSGARITLAFELHRSSAVDPFADALLLRAERVRHAFAALVADPKFMPKGGTLGFECVHLYEEKEMGAAEASLDQVKAADVSARKIKGLKNEDAVLAVAAAAAGLDVEPVRVLSNDSDGDGEVWRLASMPKKTDVKGFGFVRNCDGCRMRGITDDEVDDYAEGRLDEEIQWVSSREGKRKPFCDVEYAPGGLSFGNEASSTTFYTRAVLLVQVPAHASRKKAAGVGVESALTSERVHATKATMPPPRPKAAASGEARGATTPAVSGGKRKAPEKLEEATEEESEEDDMYEVERIVSSRKKGKRTEYLIKWKGYGDEENSWEPIANVSSNLVAEFESTISAAGTSGTSAASKPEKANAAAAPAAKGPAKAKPAAPPAATPDVAAERDQAVPLAAVGKRAAGAAASKAAAATAAAEAKRPHVADNNHDEDGDDVDARKAKKAKPAASEPLSAKAQGKQPAAVPAAAPVEPMRASAPPRLFAAPKGPAAAVTGPRQIHIEGAQGAERAMARLGGKATITLAPNAGLRELKKAIRDTFGKYRHHKLSKLMLVPKDGSASREVSKNDLVDGATVRPTYAVSKGNGAIGNFGPGRRGFGGRRMDPFMMAMLLADGGMSRGYDSDEYGYDGYGSDEYGYASDGSY